MRRYWCNKCNKLMDWDADDATRVHAKCESCGEVFGGSYKLSNYVNMRKTWSGQTKVEFSQTTIDQDIADRNNR